MRIDAEPVIVDKIDAATVIEQSASSAAVFLPFRLDDDTIESPFGGKLDELTFGLGRPVREPLLAVDALVDDFLC